MTGGGVRGEIGCRKDYGKRARFWSEGPTFN